MDVHERNLAARCDGQLGRPLRRVSLLISWTLCLALHTAAGWAQGADDARIDLRISAGRLTLRADDVALGAVLQRIAQAQNARLVISADIGARIGHWNLRQVPVEEAIMQIARPSNTIVVLDSEGASKGGVFVREIYVFGGPASNSKLTVEASPAPAQRIRELAQVLSSEVGSEARRAAAAELGDIGGNESVSTLDRALGDVDPGVRIEVIESLGRIGTNEAIRLVGQAGIGSSDPSVIAAATRVLEASTSDLASEMLTTIKSGAQPVSISPH
jgi:hypothetical protein